MILLIYQIFANEISPETTETSQVPKEAFVFLATGLTETKMRSMKQIIDELGGVLVKQFSRSVTHIVTCADEKGCTRRTLKYLYGIVTGKWIVGFDWLLDSLKMKKFISPGPYEIRGDLNGMLGPTKGRESYKVEKQNSTTQLFNGITIYIHGEFQAPDPTKSDLMGLIVLGGGKVLKTITTNINSNNDKIEKFILLCSAKTITQEEIQGLQTNYGSSSYILSHVWLLDCVSNYEVLPFIEYTLSINT